MSQWTDAAIVLAMVLGSTILGFVQECGAGYAVRKLRLQVTIKSSVFGLTALYVLVTESAKKFFHARIENGVA